MAMKKEALTNLIADDLAKRNDNWTEIDTTFELKADKATTYTKTEVDTSLDLKADKTYVDNQDTALGQRIDNIIATPIDLPEIYVDEIHDARQGSGSLGANIAEVKSQLTELASYAEFGLTANQSIPSGATYTDVALNATRKSKSYCTLENGKIKFLETGTYQIIGVIPIGFNATGSRRLKMLRNTETIAEDYKTPLNPHAVLQSSKNIDVTSINETVSFQIYQDSGVALNISYFGSLMYVQVKKVG